MTTDPHIHAKPSAVDDSWSILMQFSSPDGAEWSFFLFTQVQFWIISMYHLTSQNRAIVPGKWPVDVRDMSMAFLLYDGGQRLTAGQLKKWHCYCTVILTHCCIKLNFSSGCCLLGVVHCTHVCVCVQDTVADRPGVVHRADVCLQLVLRSCRHRRCCLHLQVHRIQGVSMLEEPVLTLTW